MNSFLRLVLLYIILLGVCTFNSLGQTPYFKHYDISDGLPSTLVYDVFQDATGYIWFGTEVGVSRFDGRQFTNYSIRDGLTDNEVFSIFEDSKGRIWFLTFNGRVSYYQDGKIHNSTNTPFLKSLDHSDSIIDAIEQEDGAISLLSSKEGIKTIYPNNQIIVNSRTATLGVQAMWYDDQNRCIQVSSNNLYINDTAQPLQLASNNGTFLIKKHETEDYSYISFDKSVNVFSKKGEPTQTFTFDFLPSNILRIYADDIYFWLGTNDGLFRIRRDNSVYTHLLKGKKISGIYLDDEDNYWFSTLGDGVYFSSNLEVFHIDKSDGLASNRINDLEFDKDQTLWIATSNDGVAQYKNEKVNAWQITGRTIHKTNRIKFIGNKTYMLSKSYIMETSNGQQRCLYQNAADILIDKFDRIWVATRTLRVFDYHALASYATIGWQNQHSEFIHRGQRDKILDVLLSRVNIMEKDEHDNIYIGGTAGFFKIISTRDQPIADTIRIIPEDVIYMEYDSDQRIFWIASKTNGVYAIQNDKIIHHITADDGLSATSCHAIKIEDANTIWVGTIRGLNRIDINHQGAAMVSDYSYVSSIGGIKINAVEVDSANLYLGTDEGLAIVPRSELFREHPPPKILPIQLYVDGASISADQSQLKHNQNDVTISFNGRSYADYGRLTYAYRLMGADDEWQSTLATEAKYPKLTPGDYQFEVKAINTSGVPSAEIETFSFSIGVPFWSTIGFKIVAISFIGLILFSIYFNRIRQLNIRHSYDKKLVQTEKDKLELESKNAEQRLIALRAQMNPHFLFNALNTIKGYYAVGQNRKANLLISKFASLLRLILDYSDRSIPLDKEIHLIQSYLELSKLRHIDAFTYQVKVSDQLDIENTAIPSMLIQPLIENAIIHGVLPKNGEGFIDVEIFPEDQYIVVRVSDNGIGLEGKQHSEINQNKKSKGLAIVKEQLSRLGDQNNITHPFSLRTLVDPDGEVAGTEAIIKLPTQSLW